MRRLYAFDHVGPLPTGAQFLYRKQYFVVLSPANPSSASIVYCDRRRSPRKRRCISVLLIISKLLDRCGIDGIVTGDDGIDVVGCEFRSRCLMLSTISSSQLMASLVAFMLLGNLTDSFRTNFALNVYTYGFSYLTFSNGVANGTII